MDLNLFDLHIQAAIFRVVIGAVALHHRFKVHQVSIKFRSLHAGEAHLIAYLHAAAAAHARAVHHDSVQGHCGGYLIWPAGFSDRLHHRQGPNSQDMIHLAAGPQQAIELVGYKTVQTKAAIIGGVINFIAVGFDLSLRITKSLFRAPTMVITVLPASLSALATGKATAAPKPPPTTTTVP